MDKAVDYEIDSKEWMSNGLPYGKWSELACRALEEPFIPLRTAAELAGVRLPRVQQWIARGQMAITHEVRGTGRPRYLSILEAIRVLFFTEIEDCGVPLSVAGDVSRAMEHSVRGKWLTTAQRMDTYDGIAPEIVIGDPLSSGAYLICVSLRRASRVWGFDRSVPIGEAATDIAATAFVTVDAAPIVDRALRLYWPYFVNHLAEAARGVPKKHPRKRRSEK